ncbi:MAG: primosomal protein N' [Turicibacter sp.]|nr:primosomal protein N' [Turicibacter sp.]
MAVAEVVVDIKNKAVDRVFDYQIPENLETVVQPGVRVMVPFGPRALAGMVLRVKASSDFKGKLRPISKVMDVVPILNAELLALGIDLAKETGATMIACFDAMIPAAMKTKYQKLLVRAQDVSGWSQVAALFGEGEAVNAEVVTQDLLPVMKEAIDAGAVEVIYEASAAMGKKMRRYVELVDREVDFSVFGRAKRQEAAVRRLLANEHPIARDELAVDATVLRKLVDKRVVRVVDVEVYRDPYAKASFKPGASVALNDAQKAVVQTINEAGGGVVLVHGVTGSGKTEVYLEAIQSVVDAGKQALVLIPEITLTTQITMRFKQRFGSAVAVLHSGLSMGEKYDEWRKILRGEVNIVIGARSAVFAPLRQIGLIIVDEEHEATYKQEEMPRYHAIEVAKRRGAWHGCPVVLGSATPSLDAYARASKGVYTLAELPQRAVEKASLPEISLIDLNRQIPGIGSGIMSVELESALETKLAKKEQIILFLNRRGYSNFMQCRECHEVVSCPNCDVTLTYHKQVNGLKCHYCNFTARVVDACPKCESPEVRFFGTGTQKVEEFLEKRFPAAKVLRMDVDSTSRKGDHQRIITAFEDKKADILLGTQMVAKGLDFPGVTLVGVLDADIMLHFPDYKASERTFQILTQVSGRAGRHEQGGSVYIETYSPNHYVMQHVKNQDYHAFYREEMASRQRFNYAPYYFHAKVLLSSLEPDALLVVSEQVNAYLRSELGDECLIIGPTMPGIARVNNRFRLHFILKYKKSPKLTEVMMHLLEHIDHKDVSIAVDYFPVHLA